MPPSRVRRAVGTLAGAGLLLAVLPGAAPGSGVGGATARLGPVSVSATALHPGPPGMLTASVQLSTSGQLSDQLDAAIAAGSVPVAVYHQQVAVGELTDLASCDGENPPPGVVNHWLHYGPLLIPGRSGGPSAPAAATLTVPVTAVVRASGFVPVTLYFARTGSVTLRLPVTAR